MAHPMATLLLLSMAPNISSTGRWAGSPNSHQMNIHVPRGIVAGSADTTYLTVNFSTGSEQSKLHYRIKGLTGWKEMKKVEKYDPYYLKISARWERSSAYS
jgi:hypothetical protein